MAQVEYIVYKKEKYPVRLSYRVFKGMKRDLGEVDLKKLESLDSDVLESMIWHGLVSGHKFEDTQLVLKREDMEDILDECMFEFLALIPVFFPEAAKLGKLAPNLNNPSKGEINQQNEVMIKEGT